MTTGASSRQGFFVEVQRREQRITACRRHRCHDTPSQHRKDKPLPSRLGPWGLWSACSVSCNAGTKTRYRTVLQKATCGRKACPVSKETKGCKEFHCCTSFRCDIQTTNAQTYLQHNIDTSATAGPEKHGKERVCKIGLFASGRCDCYCSYKAMPSDFVDYANCIDGKCSKKSNTVDGIHSFK